MKIAIASDHAGFSLKEELKKHISSTGHQVNDVGTHDESSTDYPDWCEKLTECVLSKESDLGVLVCGTGIGMSIAANKTEGIYAALCSNEYMARMSRRHNAANVLVLGSRVTGSDLACSIVDAWLAAEPEGGRHEMRRAKVAAIEKARRA